MTVGVLYRVEQLADRKEGEKPEKIHPFYSLIPLAEILSELMEVGPRSKKVTSAWQTLISRTGPELRVLHDMPVEEIKASGNIVLAEAIARMRRGEVYRQPGYDGQYGRVTIFTDEERRRLTGQKDLFAMPANNSSNSGANSGDTILNSDELSMVSPEFEKESDQVNPLAGGPALAGLNDEQIRAVTHPGGPLIISAGPGTGKTRTLTCRIAYLIEQGFARPEQILAVTFTNKAAAQMKTRLAKMLGPEAKLPAAMTFHAFCFSLLKKLENRPDHGIVDEEDRRALILEAVARAKDLGAEIDIRADVLLDMVIGAKQRILSPDDDLCQTAGKLAPSLSSVYSAYQDLLEAEGLYDYEDLICRTVMYLESDPVALENERKRYPFIFIDEYQDLNYAQYRLVKLLCPKNGHICVIGDPDQSIYGFRGSDPAYFKRYMEDFPGATSIRLTRSYRSTETILAAANHLLHRGRDRIYSGISGSPGIYTISAESERAEAVAIGKIIEQMIGGMGFDFRDFNSGDTILNSSELSMVSPELERSFADFAVLYRTRAQGDVFAEIFGSAGIPYQRANKTEAWGIPGIAEPLSAIRIMGGWGSYSDLERMITAMAPAISARELSGLKAWGRKHGLTVNGLMAEAMRLDAGGLSRESRKQLHELLEYIFSIEEKTAEADVCLKLEATAEALAPFLPKPGAKEKQAMEDIKALAASFAQDVPGFIETLALYSDPDFFRPEAEKVSLLTMHAAKGLEFPVVFVAGCEESLIPYSGTTRQQADAQEERRLFYVAVTRAMEELFLVSSKTRRIYGKTRQQKPSPFLADIPADLKKEITAAQKKKIKQVQMSLFKE